MSNITPINDISYFFEDDEKTFNGVVDDRTGCYISRQENGDVVIHGGTIPEKLANSLFIAWLLISDPEIIKAVD